MNIGAALADKTKDYWITVMNIGNPTVSYNS